ncbi:MAG: polysaccharide biosynthesis protein, partial [Giesbergeria sp.]
VFVLDMGESVRIYDLASRMVELSGMRVCSADCPGGEIEIKITGLRPGEKLYEELLIGHNPQPTNHPRVMKASEQMLPWAELEQELGLLDAAMADSNMATVRSMLQRLAGYEPPTYAPDSPEAVAAARTEGMDLVYPALRKQAIGVS